MLNWGWRASFWVCAAIGLVAGLVWYFAARDTPADHPQVSASELALIQSGLTAAAKADKKEFVPWAVVLRSKDVWAVTLSYFCFGYVAWIFFSWFYTYLAQVRGLDLKTSAFYAMLPFLAMAACSPLGGLLSDRLTRAFGPKVGRCHLAAVALAGAAVFIASGSQVQSVRVASVVLAGGAGTLYLAQSSFWSVTADISGTSSGSVSGFMNMGAQIGGMVTASLTPAIGDRYGWTASFLVGAALCVVGALAWLLVDPTRALVPAMTPEGVQR